jgi:predicted glycosyltransferase
MKKMYADRQPEPHDRPPSDHPSDCLRVALYSHDTQGLGHIRRNLTLASALLQSEQPLSILLISGTQLGSAMTKPAGVDFLALPAVAKDTNGLYRAQSLSLPLEELIALRAQTIRGALAVFQPDVLIVDKVPGGLQGELLPSLELLHQREQTHCVLGLRDVLDDAATARREWERTKSGALVKTYYDAVWIYGDPTVYDPVHEYGLAADLAGKVRYTGYLNRTIFATQQARAMATPVPLAPHLVGKRLALCLVGGGEDGAHLARAFAKARFPRNVAGLIITGPYMPAAVSEEIHALAANQTHLQVLGFVPEPLQLLQRAAYVVAMGGYNTICEILGHNKQALIVPRVQPRQEQWIRAQRLQELGLVDVLHPAHLSPRQISRWLTKVEKAPERVRATIDLQGLRRLPRLLHELRTGHTAKPVQHSAHQPLLMPA